VADLFIGYARRDRDTVEKLAAAVEAAGYTVWWDRNIVGGAEFSKDIERELDAARAVIIAWSQDAGASPWVKDEAAVARDQGKLVPIALDREIPPMGFRQYQAVDFSRWNGKPDHPAVDQLRRAIEARLDGVEPEPPARTAAAPPRRAGKGPWVVAAAVLLAILAYVIAMDPFDRGAGGPEAGHPPDEQVAARAVSPGESEPRITVAPIRVRNAAPGLDDLAASLSEEIASGLSRFSYLLVSSPGSTSAQADVGYILNGTLQKAGATLRLSTQLIDRSSGQQVWGETFDRDWDETLLLDIQDGLTDRVVASVADPYGALMRDLSQGIAQKDIDDMSAYDAVLRYFIYRQRVSETDHLETREALEHGVRVAPGNADLWAALAAITIEEYKHDYNPRPDALDRALATARKAIELKSDSASAHFALAEIHFFRQEVGPFRAAAERAIALNPRDSDATAMIGIMTAYSGDWARGAELTARARAINPNHPGWYLFGDFFDAYRQGDDARALAIAERINLPGYFADPYSRAIAHAQLGNLEQAAAALDELWALWPGVTLRYMRDEHLDKWFYAVPEVSERTLEGLRLAGME
jgi:TolB-like protein